jgi:hypothetical protein
MAAALDLPNQSSRYVTGQSMVYAEMGLALYCGRE